MPTLPNGEAPRAPEELPETPRWTLAGVAKVIAAIAGLLTALGTVGVSAYTAWAANNKADSANNTANETVVEVDRASASVFNILSARLNKLEARSEEHIQFKVDIGILTERTEALQNRMNRRYGRPRHVGGGGGAVGYGAGGVVGGGSVEAVTTFSAPPPECASDSDCGGYLECRDAMCVIPPAPAPAPKKPAPEEFHRFEDVKQYYQTEEAAWEE